MLVFLIGVFMNAAQGGHSGFDGRHDAGDTVTAEVFPSEALVTVLAEVTVAG